PSFAERLAQRPAHASMLPCTSQNRANSERRTQVCPSGPLWQGSLPRCTQRRTTQVGTWVKTACTRHSSRSPSSPPSFAELLAQPPTHADNAEARYLIRVSGLL